MISAVFVWQFEFRGIGAMKEKNDRSPSKPEWKTPRLKRISIKEVTRGPMMMGNSDGVSGMSMS